MTLITHLEPKFSELGKPKVKVIVAAIPSEPALSTSARALANELDLPFKTYSNNYEFQLVVTASRLELHVRNNDRLEKLVADFSMTAIQHTRASLVGRQPLRRALGAKSQLVIDATAGLGTDSLRLACLGYCVIAIERCRPVAALMRDALARAYTTKALTTKQLALVIGDARELLPDIHPAPDAIYLDPMFPAKRKKSAAMRKEMRWVRALAGDDEDALTLFKIAQSGARRRVVVKRPDHAPPLVPDPTVSYSGKLVRYDVYYTNE